MTLPESKQSRLKSGTDVLTFLSIKIKKAGNAGFFKEDKERFLYLSFASSLAFVSAITSSATFLGHGL